ncbi:MAG: hypothetical protein C0518_14715 [Opitutus sp.]|nr:hypothetical protein [Opitutus sp.]
MNWLRQNLFFALVLSFAGGALATEAWLLHGGWQRSKRAQAMLSQRKEERDWLARQSPTLSAENAAAIAANVIAGERRFAEFCQALQGRGHWLPKPPTRPLDAYFALAAFAERARALAARQQVELRTEERFGFSSYANDGPEPDLLGAVHRQQTVIEYLVETLCEARPRSLLAVQRERPLTDAQRAAARTAPDAASRKTGSAGDETADFFEAAPQVRLRVPGLVDTEAYRLEFTGQTQTLRALLNELAAFKLPLIVRSVEVAALAEDNSPGQPTMSAASSAPVPLVTQNLSKFSVVVEFVEVLAAPKPATP